jgi:nucleotide-binding universal stress UspA family protein
MYKRILVPLDGSEQSEEVLPLVRVLAGAGRAEVILLRVVEYPYSLYSMCHEYPPSDPDLAKTILDMKRAIYVEVNDYLERIASTLSSAELKVTAEVCEGHVVESVLASIDRLHVDLLVLSVCGQSGGSRYVMGAIADRLLREAPVPVIMVRPFSCSMIPDHSFEYRLPLRI